MGMTLQPHPASAEFDATPDEIAVVEDTWSEPIPGHLHRIGSFERWGWAFAELRGDGEDRRWVGEFRDHRARYVGPFDVEGLAEGEALEPRSAAYRLSHIDGDAIVLVNVTQDGGRRVRLRAADRSALQTAR